MRPTQRDNRSLLPAVVHRLMLSWRFQVIHAEHLAPVAQEGYVLAVPHASFLIVAAHQRRRGLVTMVSQSRDGDRAAELLSRLGYRVVRGSTSQGGLSALREMVRLGAQHRQFGLTVDGPRGPAWTVQPGVVALAALIEAPIVPVVGNGPGIVWPSWDRLRIPFPGARCRLLFGKPIRVADYPDRARAAADVERELKRLREEAGL